MMVYSDYVKQRILFYRRSGKSLQRIVLSLAEEGLVATKAGVAKFLRRFDETGTIARAPGSGQKSMMTAEAKQIVEEQMERNDETTGKELAPISFSLDRPYVARTSIVVVPYFVRCVINKRPYYARSKTVRRSVLRPCNVNFLIGRTVCNIPTYCMHSLVRI